jgi:hypothetical protein
MLDHPLLRKAGPRPSAAARTRRWRVPLLLLVLSIPFPALAFKPGIHEDICTDAVGPIVRTVDGETLQFREKAIMQIRSANSSTDISLDFFRSFKHFDSETFAAASQRLIDLKDSVISKITADPPNGRGARDDLGTALHTLQDFYAHSNWIESGHGGGTNGALGVSTLADPPRSTAFCPGNPAVLSGPGLTDVTTGYYVGLLGCGALPIAGKCYHGGPGGCDGINKDEPTRRNHDTARGLARQASKDYVERILDASGVAGNAKAIKALMRINGTLGMVIDDTGSMGGSISRVKQQVSAIVTSIGVTELQPDEYLLVRFGDPDVGPPFVTTDPGAYLARVNSLFASGGGDCPELSQTALLQAIGAAKKDSTLYLFTDASAKDAGLAGAVNSAARAKRIKITPLLSGSCSPIDPAYISNAEETGGQLFFLSPFEIDRTFDLIRPQLDGDFVTVARTKGTLPSTATQEIAVPVDASITRAVFSAAIDFKQSVVVRRPSGVPVAPGETGVTVTQLSTGTIVTVEHPEVGTWHLAATGSGQFTLAAYANSPLELFQFDFVELVHPPHQGWAPISGQPVVGSSPTALAALVGPYSSVDFRFVDQTGATLQPIGLAKGDPDAAADELVGSVALPSVPFRVAVSGLDGSGNPFERLFPPLFRAQTVRVSLDPTSATDTLPIGGTRTLRFTVENLGAPGTFSVLAVDSRRFVSRFQPSVVSLGTGERATVAVDLSIPASAVDGSEDLVTVTATSTANADVNNSANVEMLVTNLVNQPPDCGAASGVRIDLWPPDHDLVPLDVLAATGITDPDGDAVAITVDGVTQDELVSGTGSGDTSPDALTIAGLQIRAERDGNGNGRVYQVSFTASDGVGGSCSGMLAVTVPHSQNGVAAVDDGQLYDSTQP